MISNDSYRGNNVLLGLGILVFVLCFKRQTFILRFYSNQRFSKNIFHKQHGHVPLGLGISVFVLCFKRQTFILRFFSNQRFSKNIYSTTNMDPSEQPSSRYTQREDRYTLCRPYVLFLMYEHGFVILLVYKVSCIHFYRKYLFFVVFKCGVKWGISGPLKGAW